MTAGQRPSDLATLAARSAGTGATTVRFDVTHLFPPGLLPWPPADPVAVDAPRPGERVAEVMASRVAMLGLRARTWTPQDPEEVPQNVAITDLRTVAAPPRGDVASDLPDASDGQPVGPEFVGHSAVNPSFLYDRTRVTEVLVTLLSGPWRPDLGDCRMVGLAVEALTSAAFDAAAPVLLLQSPVAPYRNASPSFRKDGSGEEPRPARATAIRMVVGLDASRPDRRLAMMCRIAEFAKRHGCGLQVSDSRLGRVAGEWWDVLPPRPGTYRREKARQVEPTGSFPTEVRVVTFVGPARVGASAAVFADLVGRRVGILAVVEAVLQQIAFVHVVLPVAPARAGRCRAPTAAVRHDLARSLGHLASECGLTPRRQVAETRGVDLSPASDYCALDSGPVPVVAGSDAEPTVVDHAAPGVGGENVARPIWVAWTFPDGHRYPDLSAVVRDRLESLPEVVSATVDYVRIRRLRGGGGRGRAKLSMVLAERFAIEALPAVLGGICETVQTVVAAQYRQIGLDAGDVDLRVVWRERWLGAR